jgi:hypothetical protein
MTVGCTRGDTADTATATADKSAAAAGKATPTVDNTQNTNLEARAHNLDGPTEQKTKAKCYLPEHES